MRRALGLAAATLVSALALAACTSAGSGGNGAAKTVYVTVTPSGSLSTGSSTTPAPVTPTTTKPKPKPVKLGAPVHLSSPEGDGSVWGVGMPVLVQFSRSPTSKAAFEKAAKVTVNGRPAGGAWYFEKPYADEAMQAHYRPANYWPAHATIHVALPVNKLSAGKGLSFANDLTLNYRTGDYHYSVVDARALNMKVYNNGRLARTIKVSLGKASTPTMSGTKIVMSLDRVQHMTGPGYAEDVPWSVRVTSSGEFVHAAKWNTHIGVASTSHGCTNLGTADAIWFYRFSKLGDIVTYPNAPGKLMPSWDGLGDWNVNWSIWSGGGDL